jgi:hypothetical protein
MRIDEVIDKQDQKILKAEWNMLQQSDPLGNKYMDARGPSKYNPSRLASIAGMNNPENYPTTTNSKPEVKAMVADKTNSSLKLLFYIMAWGGMVNRANNPKLLYRKLKTDKEARRIVNDALNEIRFGSLSNSQAFDLLQGLRKQGALPGLGVSFFTKVLYFLRPGKNAFILDQFTAKGMNYLHSKDPAHYPQIDMDNDFPANNLTGTDYDAYNKGLRQLSMDLKKSVGNLSDEDAEFLLFNPYGGQFRPVADKYHASRTDLKKKDPNRFKYIQRATQSKQDTEQQSQLSLSSGQAQELWNKHMMANSTVAAKFRSLSPDTKQDFQTEFIDDVAEALRNGSNANSAIQNLLNNYQNISEN